MKFPATVNITFELVQGLIEYLYLESETGTVYTDSQADALTDAADALADALAVLEDTVNCDASQG